MMIGRVKMRGPFFFLLYKVPPLRKKQYLM